MEIPRAIYVLYYKCVFLCGETSMSVGVHECVHLAVWCIRILICVERVITYKIFRQYVAKRQKSRPEWRRTKTCFIKTYSD